MNSRNRKNNNKGSLGGLIVLAIVFLVNIASTGAGTEFIAVMIAIAALIAVILAVVVIVKKALGTAKVSSPRAEKFSSYLNREEQGAEEQGFKRREPVVISYDERAQEKNFVRDRARRLAQLDGFLKNGIIEKEEYNILKARYLKEKV